jgi:hypothetical protein
MERARVLEGDANIMSDNIETAQIARTFFGVEDHGMIIHMQGEGWGQGFGNIALDGYNRQLDRREGWGDGIMLIRAILEAVGVESWEELKGKYCRIKREQGMIVAVGHVMNNKWADTRDFIERAKA